MHIVIVNHYLSHRDQPGLQRHYNLTQNPRNTLEYSILSASYNHYSKKQIGCDDLGNNFYIFKTRFEYTRNNWRRLLNWLEFSWRLIFSRRTYIIFNKADVVIGSSPHLFAAFSALIISRTLKKKFIFEIRDIYPLTMIKHGVSKFHPLVLVMSAIEYILLRSSHGVIYAPTYTDLYLKKYNLKAPYIHLPTPVIELDLKLDSEFEFDNKSSYIAYAGSLTKTYCLDLLLEALSLIEDGTIKLLIIGDGPERKNLEVTSHNLGLEKAVFFLGYLAPSKAHAILINCDVLYSSVRSSDLYEFGTNISKMREYFLLGRYVLSLSDFDDDLVRLSGYGSAVKNYTPTFLSKEIKKVLSIPPEQRNTIGLKARNWIRENYNSEVLNQKLIEFCRSIL